MPLIHWSGWQYCYLISSPNTLASKYYCGTTPAKPLHPLPMTPSSTMNISLSVSISCCSTLAPLAASIDSTWNVPFIFWVTVSADLLRLATQPRADRRVFEGFFSSTRYPTSILITLRFCMIVPTSLDAPPKPGLTFPYIFIRGSSSPSPTWSKLQLRWRSISIRPCTIPSRRAVGCAFASECSTISTPDLSWVLFLSHSFPSTANRMVSFVLFMPNPTWTGETPARPSTVLSRALASGLVSSWSRAATSSSRKRRST
mmetsp:Transcript_30372/g.88800  ORF Transcript_30372/g.88800 Transcript_30372/m.88800 type:complete len:258 (-) Transcript_30372:1595-2368(-)